MAFKLTCTDLIENLDFANWDELGGIQVNGESVFRILWGNTRRGSTPLFRTNIYYYLAYKPVFL